MILPDQLNQQAVSRGRLARALIEVCVIVTGIAIALAADAWYEEQQDRAYELQTLEQLRSEFEANAAQLDTVLAAHRATAEAARVLVAISGRAPEISADSVLVLLDYLDVWWTFSPRMGALESVLSSGGIRNISNDSLRVQLAGWPGLVADYQEDEERAIDFANGQQARFLIESGVYADLRSPRDGLDRLREVVSNARLRDIAAYRGAFYPSLLDEGETIRLSLIQMRRMIDVELGL